MKESINTYIKKANSGDKKALEQVVLHIQDLVYNLSLKMLFHPEDAKDATQEILIKVITHLSTFTFQSKFSTWVYRVATNYLLTQKGKQTKEFAYSFEDYAELIDLGQSNEVRFSKNQGEIALLEEEIKVGCSQGLLLCLNELDRAVYILSEILEFNSVEGSEILEISSENYRKKLSRSRSKIRNFMNNKCGLYNPKNPCRCRKKIDFSVEKYGLSTNNLQYANFTNRSIDLVDKIKDLERSVAIYRSMPDIPTPDVILKDIQQILNIN